MSAELVGLTRLMLVDGEERDRRALRAALEAAGPPLEIVEVPSAAVALAEAERARFDCLLLELKLPDREGTWLLEQLQARGITSPVLVVAGQGDADTAVRLMRAGAADYLPKGLEPDRLWQRVRQAVRMGRAEEEARRAREAQRRAESLMRLIVDSVPPLIAYIDRHYRYLWNNRSYQGWFGEAFDGSRSQPVAEVLGEEVFAAVKPYLDRALGGETVSYERVLPYRQGPRWVHATYVPHVGPDGEVQGLVALVQDVSQRRGEQERRERQSEFEQQLLGIVSHDLRNPIGVIAMNASMLLLREDLPPGMNRPLARVVASAERATRMVRDLLDFTQARLGGGIPVAPRPVDLHDVSRQMVDEIQTSFPDRELRFESTGQGQGQWDPDRLGQILANLLSNALTYSPADTPVRLRCCEDPDDVGQVLLEVHNQGEPIPPEILPGLFQPFTRGPDRRQGGSQRSIGLGLFIVKQLVEAHGGRVEVRSTAGEGTTFQVRLPRAPGSADPTPTSPPSG